MGLVSFSDIQTGDDADAALWNTRFAAILNALNGNIETVNLKDGAVTVAKLASGVMSTQNVAAPYKFSAYRSTNQALTNANWTRINADAEEYDTGNNYDSTTNYRFTAPVAGYYLVSGEVCFNSAANGALVIAAIYKNGTEHKRGIQMNGNAVETHVTVTPPPMYLVAGDYIELWAYNSGGSPTVIAGGASRNYFGGFLLSTT